MAILYYKKSLQIIMNKHSLRSLIKIYLDMNNIKEIKYYCSIYIKNFKCSIIENIYNNL
jgi:hypothetical protein